MPDTTLVSYGLPALGAVLALLCLWGAFRSARRRRLIESLPTSKTTGVFIGLVEVKGTAESSEPLTSYLAETRCVHYSWRAEEHWSRTVTESYTDSKGQRRTRTRRESGWKTVADGGETIPFYLEDDCGVILVQPEGANIEPLTVFSQTCGISDPLYYGKGPPGAVAHSDYRRRFSETALPLHAPLYIMGQAREREDIVAPEITQDENAPLFLISTRTEDQVRAGYNRGLWLWNFFGLVPAVGAWIWRDVLLDLVPEMRWPVYLGVAAVYLAAVSVAWLWLVYNSLVELRQRVRQAWSQVDVQLKRRHDLIPNLVRVVEGLREHEAGTQEALAAMRSQLAATAPGVTGPDFAALHQTVTLLAERYPELKAQTAFLALQQNLIDTEQRIALARGYFNEIATHFNTQLEVVPERFVARLAALQPHALMAANEFERAPVAVQLSD